MRILGVDPGLRITGYGMVEADADRLRLIQAGALRTRPSESLPLRLRSIHEGLVGVIAALRPDEVAVEGLFHARNASSALRLGHARGVILLAVGSAEIPLFEYSPREVKQAVVGTGRAEKHQVQEMVRILLRQDHCLAPTDVSDAVSVAVCHANTLPFRRLLKRQIR
ncbi:MAG: crossover junction endodeoxyribonuclease RuvC [Acidobacteriota bacterium]